MGTTVRPERGLLERDRDWIWHPYTPQCAGQEPLAVVGARGAWLELADGRRIIDGISSWWVNLHGHAHPEIARAVAEQAARLEHVIFAGFTHEPAVELAGALLGGARACGMEASKVFYSDNGSTAVEAALKLAYQFHLNRGDKARPRFLALSGAFHGDTFGSMAVSDRDAYHARFKDLLAQVDFVRPGDLDALEAALAGSPGAYSAMIVEPLVQGAAGMRMYPAAFLRGAWELCRRHGVLLICDEVFTGFHRTGRLFAFEHAGIRPDLVTLSKALTGGFLPLAATLCSGEVHDAFRGPGIDLAFLHGHSFTANPIACAAALASWRLLRSDGCQARLKRIVELTEARTSALRGAEGVTDARALGIIGAVELAGQGSYGSERSLRLRRAALERGILLRPIGETLYCVPPLCISDTELERVYDVISELRLVS